MEGTIEKNPYDSEFFKDRSKSQQSADIVVPLLTTFFHPRSVIDLGCGTGEWLKSFKQEGCRILGIDGEYVQKDNIKLEIEGEEFIARDLSVPFFGKQPVKGKERFDLAVSLEVAEHLPPERAESFVYDLTCMSDVVLFSAAVPGQPGTNHINCRFQDYWESLFLSCHYKAADFLRPMIWNDHRINVIYRNNMLLYYNAKKKNIEEMVHDFPALSLPSMNAVHPELYSIILSGYLSVIKSAEELNSELMGNLERAVEKLEEIAEGKRQ